MDKAPEDASFASIVPEGGLQAFDPLAHSKEDWEVAQKRFYAIEPLLPLRGMSAEHARTRAVECGVNVATIYRWLRAYRRSPSLSSLLKARTRRWSSRLEPAQDAVIDEAIQSSYLTPQRRKARTICRIVAARCLELNIAPPHANTVQNRIHVLAPELLARKRYGPDKARSLRPIEGSFPLPSGPLGVVQIDHTKLDIILVDEEHRLPVGRPWITVALDVYSRMVVGYHLSFEPPGSLTIAMCIANAISRKDEWLAKHNIDGEWPCAGIMRCVHVDNAKEFHSHVLKLACMEYGIDLQHRPPGRPQYGGHIERFMRTLATEVHELEGTTFSNISERDSYDSEKRATFTLEGLRLWVAKYIIDVYHQRLHSAISTTPLARYKAGINHLFLVGQGPRMPADPKKLELDFLPGTQRAVQRYGIQVDRIRYWHDVLRAWVDAPDPKKKSRKRLFWVKRDPRDIKFVYFLDPLLKSYHRIPCRDTSLPSVSLSQYKIADAVTRAEGQRLVNVPQLTKAISQMGALQDSEGHKTKSLRKARERRRTTPVIHEEVASRHLPANLPACSPIQELVGDVQAVQISPFEGSED